MSVSGSSPAIESQELLVRTAPSGYDVLLQERAELLAQMESELPKEIFSPQDYKGVAELETRLDAYLKKWDPLFNGEDGSVSLAHKAWKAACRVREVFLGVPTELKKRCARLRGDYERREDDARRAEERRLAELERQRLLTARNEEAKLLKQQGQAEMAAAVRSQPVHAPAVALPTAVPAARDLGVRPTRTIRTWRIPGCTDAFGGRKDKAARKRAAQLIDRAYLDLDDAAITNAVKNPAITKIPGIEIYEDKV